MAEYRKQCETKVVRTTHRVTYNDRRETAGGIIAALRQVPPDAKLIDCGDQRNQHDEYEHSYFVFEEERTDG